MEITHPRIIKPIAACHRAVYRWTGGRIGGKRLGSAPILLLTTRGRKTGRQRTTPLIYLADGDAYVVVASFAGNESDPAWWLNLQADPRAEIQIGRRTLRVRARRADEAEAESLWPRLDGVWDRFKGYRGRTARTIPLVRLEPAA